MADFCNKCAKEHGFETDIDIVKIFEDLTPGYSISGFICEGCAMDAVAKTESGDLQIGIYGERNWKNANINDYK